MYTIFVFVSTYNVVGIWNEDNYHFEQGLRTQFTQTEFNHQDSPSWGKSFEDIATVLELYQWLRGPFLRTAYGPSTFDGSTSWQQGEHRGSIRPQSKIVGGIRIGQLRLTSKACEQVPQIFMLDAGDTDKERSSGWDCTGRPKDGRYSREAEDTTPFGRQLPSDLQHQQWDPWLWDPFDAAERQVACPNRTGLLGPGVHCNGHIGSLPVEEERATWFSGFSTPNARSTLGYTSLASTVMLPNHGLDEASRIIYELEKYQVCVCFRTGLSSSCVSLTGPRWALVSFSFNINLDPHCD